MDSYASGGVGATIIVVIGLLYKFTSAADHKRIRSKCCGYSASIDVDDTTPKIESAAPPELKNKTPE
jgi:hypothetical protein